MNKRKANEGAGFDLRVVVETETFRRVRLAVADGISPLLIVGAWGTGKTTLLKLLEYDWSERGGRACFVSLANIYRESDLFSAFYEQLAPAASAQEIVTEPLVISSSANDLSESIVTLIGSEGPSPLILLDGLDETLNVYPVLRIARLLSERTNAIVVVSSRQTAADEMEDIPFHRIQISPLTDLDVQNLFKARGVEQDSLWATSQLREIIDGNPLAAELVANYLQHYSSDSLQNLVSSKADTLQIIVRKALERVLAIFADEGKRTLLLRTLALLAIRGSSTASELGLSEESYILDLCLSSAFVHRQGHTFTISHSFIASEMLSIAGALPPAGTSLRDLEFGAEEAERDSLLTKSFIDPPGLEDLYAIRKSIAVGDRGAGKSALFRELTRKALQKDSNIQVIPLEDPAELMLRLEADGSNLMTAEQYRAAWLLSLACSLAKHLEFKSPRQKRMAVRIRSAVPGGKPDTSVTGRLLSVWGRIRRTSIKFQLGPIVLEPAKAPNATFRGGGGN